MNIPRHWQRAQRGEFFGWGWSSESDAAAHAMAEARLAQIEQLYESGELSSHVHNYYTDRPVREAILREFHGSDGSLSALVTRNAYGSLVLNTAHALFVDVDLPEPKAPPQTPRPVVASLLGRLFRSTKAQPPAPPPPDPAAEIIAKAEAWAQARPGWGWRIYRTKAGLRLLATHATFAPDAPEVAAVFDALGADPLYRRLCTAQRCFRARLTPKPWRSGHIACAVRWPWMRADSENEFNAWQKEYTESCKDYATCEVAADVGVLAVHPEIAPLLEWHDAVTRVGSGLPLA